MRAAIGGEINSALEARRCELVAAVVAGGQRWRVVATVKHWSD
jgi:hypothetical protein